MTEPPHTVISVRGDAQLEVPPDVATIYAIVRADERSKSAALHTVARRLDSVVAALRELGGVPITAGAERLPLCWLSRSVRSYAEARWDEQQQVEVPTGRIFASVDLRVEVRDFALLDAVGASLAQHEALQIANVDWSADRDNAGWDRVHADAIEATIRKARAYAAALRARLLSLDHLADVGLLSAPDAPVRTAHALGGWVAHAGRDDGGSVPSLDPEPQMLAAAVEARFSASVADLGESAS
jgi:uncharacterized protein